ncbi:hypothetical protein BD770DRAFT_425374 [Pilaira anomala]|nr:hypothetical protein BD770DRAFT_425374 [Pilaira anomala]
MNNDSMTINNYIAYERRENQEDQQTQQQPDAAELAEKLYQQASTAKGNQKLLVNALDLFFKKIQMGVTLPNKSGQVFLAVKKDNEIVHVGRNMDIIEEGDDDGPIKPARFGKICNVSPDEIKLRIDDYQVVDTDLYQAKAMSTLTCEADPTMLISKSIQRQSKSVFEWMNKMPMMCMVLPEVVSVTKILQNKITKKEKLHVWNNLSKNSVDLILSITLKTTIVIVAQKRFYSL